jgi:phage shock protein C
MTMRKIYRAKKDKMIAGICGGLGEMFEIDPTLIRLGLVFIGLVTGVLPFIIAYVIGWIIIPMNPESEDIP